MGDIFDPYASRIEPGSLRRPPALPLEGGPLPAASGVQSAAPGMVEAIIEAFNRLKRGSGLPVQEVPHSLVQLNSYLLGTTNAIQIDEPLRRERRIVVIINTSALNDVWWGPDSTTRVNFGDKIPANVGRSLPLSERVRIWAVSNAAGTVVSVLQFAT